MHPIQLCRQFSRLQRHFRGFRIQLRQAVNQRLTAADVSRHGLLQKLVALCLLPGELLFLLECELLMQQGDELSFEVGASGCGLAREKLGYGTFRRSLGLASGAAGNALLEADRFVGGQIAIEGGIFERQIVDTERDHGVG